MIFEIWVLFCTISGLLLREMFNFLTNSYQTSKLYTENQLHALFAHFYVFCVQFPDNIKENKSHTCFAQIYVFCGHLSANVKENSQNPYIYSVKFQNITQIPQITAYLIYKR